jgi:UDP-3-O-[3-hydroxymyristoyl] glucosamine N-acyltransferase
MEDPASGPASALLEPLTTIGDPPRYEGDGHNREELPPERQPEGGNFQHDHDQPEHLALHVPIVGEDAKNIAQLSFAESGCYTRCMKRTVKEVAELVDAVLVGDGNAEVSGIASLRSAKPGDLVFVEEQKNLAPALQSAATAVIAGPFAGRQVIQKPLLLTEQPRRAFARAAKCLNEAPPVASGVHASALVHRTAKLDKTVAVDENVVIREDVHIGRDTWIGAGCVIGAGTKIGRSCRLHPHVTIYPGAVLADRVVVHAGAVLGSDGFGYVRDAKTGRYEKFPQIGRLEIEDDVEIGANSTVDRGALDITRIRRGTKIDNLVHVGHNVDIGEDVVIAAQTGLSGSAVVGNQAIIGGQVGIADHVQIESGAILGAQSGIPSKKVIRGKGVVFWGTPARPIKQYLKELAFLAKLTKEDLE